MPDVNRLTAFLAIRGRAVNEQNGILEKSKAIYSAPGLCQLMQIAWMPVH